MLLPTSSIAQEVQSRDPAWKIDQAQILRQAIVDAQQDALPLLPLTDLDSGIAQGEGAQLDQTATALALRLARMHLLGWSKPAQKAGWNIADSDADADVETWLAQSLAMSGLAVFIAALRPAHPDYAALRAAYATETDDERKRTLARNMERWRWLPRSLGSDYVLVNAAFFEARLWREDKLEGTWPVIVGKTSTPTPVFATRITAVTFNPWWNVPASIVRERGGRFPASQGYVRIGGQWRQKPGPGNALGQMKLEMANPYSVLMHDTPNKSLFERDQRAFSHGCVRTGDAIGYAATLLARQYTREQVDTIVGAGKTVTISLEQPLPVYIAYFTAAPDADGVVAYRPDVYRRDGRLGDARLARANEDLVPCRS
jgi:murein L,D-transpeptidase YcbB/YkuD